MSLFEQLQQHVTSVVWTPRLTLMSMTFAFTIADLFMYPKPTKDAFIHPKNTIIMSKTNITSVTLVFTGIWSYYYKYQYIGNNLGSKKLTTTEMVAYGVAIFGYLLRNYSKYILGRHFTYTISIISDHKLIDYGPYSMIRHPGYTGHILSFIGNAIWLKNWLYWIMCINSIKTMVNRITFEEEMLNEKLGDDYKEYEKKVPYKLIPYIY
eukprot:118865_1